MNVALDHAEPDRDLAEDRFVSSPQPGAWRERGRCRTAPTELFFPDRGDDCGPAKAVCRRCPVLGECRAYALGLPWLKGVWGGLSEQERRVLRRAGAAAGCEAAVTEPGPSSFGSLWEALAALAAHPGRWARVAWYPSPNSAGALASQLRRGRKRRLPAGRWQFRPKRPASGGSELWALYEGPSAGSSRPEATRNAVPAARQSGPSGDARAGTRQL